MRRVSGHERGKTVWSSKFTAGNSRRSRISYAISECTGTIQLSGDQIGEIFLRAVEFNARLRALQDRASCPCTCPFYSRSCSDVSQSLEILYQTQTCLDQLGTCYGTMASSVGYLEYTGFARRASIKPQHNPRRRYWRHHTSLLLVAAGRLFFITYHFLCICFFCFIQSSRPATLTFVLVRLHSLPVNFPWNRRRWRPYPKARLQKSETGCLVQTSISSQLYKHFSCGYWHGTFRLPSTL